MCQISPNLLRKLETETPEYTGKLQMFSNFKISINPSRKMD